MSKKFGVYFVCCTYIFSGLPAVARAQGAPQPAPGSEPPLASPAPTPEGRAALEGAVDAATYIVGPGDRLLVELWGLHELSSEVEVTAEGRVFVPRVGVFAAGGEKLSVLRTSISDRLRAIYPNLHANVTLARPRTFLVNVVGAVVRPGSYSATALTHVSALVPRATPLANASTRRVEIRRKGRSEKIIADLVRFSLLGDSTADPTVLDGDTVFVPGREMEVEVTGAVKRPGRYELVSDRSLRELLELAGGRSSDAANSLPPRLTTRDRGDRLVVRSLSVKDAATTALHSGDSVHIPSLNDLRRVVVVEGAIVGGSSRPEPDRRPGLGDRPNETPMIPNRDVSVVVPYVDGDGVSDLIIKVGGLQPWADGPGSYLLRPVAGGQRQRIAIDVVAISARKAPDQPVQAGDTLVVPSRRDAVVVGGAVQHPGLFPYSRDLHPLDYITLAGGATRTGIPSSARVLKRSGGSQHIKYVNQIEPGDVISVPEAKISAAEWVQIVLILANLAVTTVALVITLRR